MCCQKYENINKEHTTNKMAFFQITVLYEGQHLNKSTIKYNYVI